MTQYGFQEGGWVAAVSNLFFRRADVYNRGYGGYNTRWARWILPSLLPKGRTKHLLATVWFGANDAAQPGERAHVPIDEFEDNLRHIVSHMRETAMHVIIITPPPVHGPTRLRFQLRKFGEKATGVLERNNDLAGQYAAACRRVAEAEHVVLVDLFEGMLKEGESEWPVFLGSEEDDGDGLHFSAAGQRFVGKQVAEAISAAIPSIFHMPFELPRGSAIDVADWKASILEHQGQARAKREGVGLWDDARAQRLPSAAAGDLVLGFVLGVLAAAAVVGWRQRGWIKYRDV